MQNRSSSDSVVLLNETQLIKKLLPRFKFSVSQQQSIITRSEQFIAVIRANKNFSIEEFINRFGLSTDEGIAIMCLAESLLRIPDLQTSKEFVSDKLSNKSWESFLFKKSKSFKTVFSSFGIYFSGKFTDIVKSDNVLAKLIDRFGQPVFLKTLRQAIMYLSKSFVFAENIKAALEKKQEFLGYRFAFDLLGESARTKKQSEKYYKDYINAIECISKTFNVKEDVIGDITSRPNLSVKLTALYPRFEYPKLNDIRQELMPKIINLIEKIKESNLTITFDAEESFRLDAYITFLSEVIEQPILKDFNGIGLVVQAYQTRSYSLIEQIILLAKKTNKKISIRLVKGAYWDSEIKHAQVNGLAYYPVFTKKEYTDANYIACARLILENNDYIYPQFATHNALTISTIMELAGTKSHEFQKLYGMGDALHTELVNNTSNVRIYAPVGKSDDLLAYLISFGYIPRCLRRNMEE
jgi:RHH-type proline utilization regulon transcriptional repressor/proline dehydrogenase/delta 1-pyrroline-5-carboxylate dehydrogenase